MKIKSIILLFFFSYLNHSNLTGMINEIEEEINHKEHVKQSIILGELIKKGDICTKETENRYAFSEQIATKIKFSKECQKILLEAVTERLKTYKQNEGFPPSSQLLVYFIVYSSHCAKSIADAANQNIINLNIEDLVTAFLALKILSKGPKEGLKGLSYKDLKEVSDTYNYCVKVLFGDE